MEFTNGLLNFKRCSLKKKNTFNRRTTTYQSNFCHIDPANKVEEMVVNMLHYSVVKDIENSYFVPLSSPHLYFHFFYRLIFYCCCFWAGLDRNISTVPGRVRKGSGDATENNTLLPYRWAWQVLVVCQWWSGEAYPWKDAPTSSGQIMTPRLLLGIRMKSLNPLSEPALVQWELVSFWWATMAALKWIDHAVSGPHVHQNRLNPAEQNLWCYATQVGQNVEKYQGDVPLI